MMRRRVTGREKEFPLSLFFLVLGKEDRRSRESPLRLLLSGTALMLRSRAEEEDEEDEREGKRRSRSGKQKVGCFRLSLCLTLQDRGDEEGDQEGRRKAQSPSLSGRNVVPPCSISFLFPFLRSSTENGIKS